VALSRTRQACTSPYAVSVAGYTLAIGVIMRSVVLSCCVSLALASQDCIDGECPEPMKGRSLLQTVSHRLQADKADGGTQDCESDVGSVHEFTVDGQTRCFNLYTPQKPGPMPVVVYFHGKGGKAFATCKKDSAMVLAADAMEFALLCADAYEDWQFPSIDGELGVGSSNPQPCTSKDTPDADYVQQVLSTIQGDPSGLYDAKRIYFQGFSQGSMMTAWASTCFAGQIRGATQAGSGLKVAGAAVTEEWCKGSSNRKCAANSTDGNNIPGGACSQASCEYFPIKPTKVKNVVGGDLKWCIFAGCSDYLLGSLLSQDQYLTTIGAPHNFTFYDGAHTVPQTDWMQKVAQCHEWPNAPVVDPTLWLSSCDGVDTGTNDQKLCLGETGCGGGGGGGGGGGSGGDSGSCPKFCTEKLSVEKACSHPKCDPELCQLDCPDEPGDGGSGGDGANGGDGGAVVPFFRLL